jgi:ABC-type glycerol-3-phosphate transport system substrate-binding protein
MTAGDDTDIGILAVPEFGTWAGRGELVRVPAAIRTLDHSFQWTGVLPAYREQLIEWGGQAQAVPLAGDGFVVVYRADRLADATFIAAFHKTFGRNPAVPATWEEFADLAVAFAALDGKPSLPALAGADVADLFFRVAACYDRPATADSNARIAPSLHFDVMTGDPRLDAPGFAAAANWLARLTETKCFAPVLPAGTRADPAAALEKGDAALAVVSLTQLAGLRPKEGGPVPARFGLAALPGTRTFTNPENGMPILAAAPNYIPYFAGGRLGVVRTRCPNVEAAFDLLAELGGPVRSLEILSTPGLGAGPFRVSHLERDRLGIWYGYGFDAEHSKQLQDALRQYVRMEVKPRVIGLREPDQGALSDAAATELATLLGGRRADDALARLTAAWKQIDEKTPKETRIRWR